MPKVIITEGPGAGKQYPLDQAAILGRLETNDIPVKDGKASREHAKIYKQGQAFSIVDLNSSNGTFVNGLKITKHTLADGDEISIGMVIMRFELEEADKPKPTGSKRKSLEELEKAETAPPKAGGESAAAGAAKGGSGSIVLKSHQPMQFSKVKGGNPILGFDLDQLSDGARIAAYFLLIGVFALLIYVGYMVVAG
ncbi:MAG: FHA domain-containing protein [Planctomycetes bacterium]|nr:FHA domain-containing protein [Planctomycetota bacterium]